MPRPDEGLIHAWLDGELDAAEAARVAQLVETDAEWGAAAAEARGLIAASSRIVKALDVVPASMPAFAGSKASGTAPRRFVVRGWMRVAATIVLVAGLGYVANSTREPAQIAGSPAANPTTNPTGGPTAGNPTAADDAAAKSAAPSPAVSPERLSPSTPPAPTPGARGDAAAGATETGTKAAALSDLGALERREMAKTTAAAPPEVTQPVTPPPAAPPPVVTREQVVGAAAPQAAAPAASTDARRSAQGAAARDAAPQTARLIPRQVIERAEPSPLAAMDAYATTGCWRTRTTAPFDTLLLEPRLTPERGDTLRLEVVQRTVSARVVFVGANALSGTATDSLGRRHPFSATRVSCP